MNNEKELLKQANKIRVMRGKWDDLLTLKQQILAVNKNCDKIYYIFAQYLTDNEDYSLAEKYVKKAISLNNKEQEYFDLYAKILMKWIDTCVKEDENIGLDFKKKRDKDLKKVIEQSIKLKPTVLNYWNLAGYYYSNKNYKKTLEAYNKCIEIDNTDTYLYETRAAIKKDLKDNEGALIDYEKALELNPNIAGIGTYLDISDIYKNLNNLEKALEYIDLAIEKCPQEEMKYYSMYSDKAQILCDLKRFDEALEAQLKDDEIWLKEFGEIQSYTTTGWFYIKTKQYKQALKYFNKAIKNNEYYNAYLAKAALFIELKKFQKVIKICDQALSLAPPEELIYGFYMNKGLAYYYLKDLKKALENFKLSAKANPQYTDASIIKYYTEFRLGKCKRAIKSIERINKKYPDNPIYIGHLLAAYYLQKRYSDIIELCNQLLPKHPESSMLYIFKALSLREIGDQENFEINLKKVYELENSDNEETIFKDFYYYYNINLSPLKIK